jgi:cation diffusion facilitator CzcD-associated flavoprotein CzcO
VEPAAGDRKWSVKVKDLQRDTVAIELFDAVMVCNGHYFEPRIPNISGQNVFTGKQIHSHDYRVPEFFDGKNVVVLGAGPSGIYIIRESLALVLE